MSAWLAAAVGLALIALLTAERLGSQTGRWIAKPLASSGFVALAVERGAAHSAEGRAILAALALSWVGDLFLIPKAPRWFRLGLFSFLLGHIAYCAAFVIRGVAWPVAAAAALVLAAIALAVARWILPHVEARMRPPVIAYITVISAMVALAVGAERALDLRLAAALAFYVSDLSVARHTFVARSFWNRLWGLPLYYGAQVLFAFCSGIPR